MRCHRFGRPWFALGLILTFSLLVGMLPLAVYADCPGNVLVNAGFEEGFSARGAGEVEVANGWTPWWQDGPFQDEGLNRRPEFKPEDASRFGNRRVREGNFGQKWGGTFATHHAGVFQQVNVPAQSVVKLSAWAQAWSSNFDDPSVSDGGKYHLSIGIDPTGGTDWSSANIVWSPQNTTLDQWVQLSVETRAQAGTVTVYLRGDAEWRTKHNDAYFDDVCLTYVAPTPKPTTPPKATNTPTITPTPTAAPSATPTDTPPATPTPVPAQISVLAFEDANGNGTRDGGEALLAGVHVELQNMQGNPITAHTTDGASEPFVFDFLSPGSYILAATDPDGFTSTSPNQWAVVLVEGSRLDLYFADQFVSEPTATAVPEATTTLVSTESVPTKEATLAPTSMPAETDDEKGGLSGLYAISGILVAAVALLLPIVLRALRRVVK